MTPTDRETSDWLAGAEAAASPPDGGQRASEEALAAAEGRSLFEDLEVLIQDGKTYLEAELNFQKTRARFTTDRAKRALIFGLAALVFVFLALIGLTVGLIIALTPLLSAWGATAVVVGLLGIGAALAASSAIRRVKELAQAFGGTGEKP